MSHIAIEKTRPLRVAVLAHALRVGGGASVGKNMIWAMARVAPQHRYLFTIPPGLGYEEVCQAAPDHDVSVCDHPGRLAARVVYELFQLPRLIRRFHPDVILALGNKGLPGLPCVQALLCHNPYLLYPQKHFGTDPLRRIFLTAPWIAVKRHCLRRSLRSTQLLLCQTQPAIERIRRHYGYEGKTLICSNAISAFISKQPEVPPLPTPLRPFARQMKLFCLTHYYPHKNLEAFVELFRRYRSALEGVVAVLTISPEQDSSAAKLLRAIQRYGLEDKIINVGPLQPTELETYYRNCQALVMPTFLESFSGTYLEAMHFGVPILTSDLDFAHAVCGEAARYFDPWEPGSIRDAILAIKRDAAFASALVANGTRRLAELRTSWDDVVRRLFDELVRLVAVSGSPSLQPVLRIAPD
jgi:glycosyltransferase involved in cell wall biosynthesis